MKKWLAIIMVAALSLFCATLSIAKDKDAKGKDNGPEVIKIDTNKAGKSVPAFPHRKHQELPDTKGKCTSCHHKNKEGEKMQSCAVCHGVTKDEKTGAPMFKDAFHKKCQTCHNKQTAKPELKKCTTCHGKSAEGGAEK